MDNFPPIVQENPTYELSHALSNGWGVYCDAQKEGGK